MTWIERIFTDNFILICLIGFMVYYPLKRTGFSINNCRIIAFVVQATNNQGRKEKAVINAQVVKAGLNNDFDYEPGFSGLNRFGGKLEIY